MKKIYLVFLKKIFVTILVLNVFSASTFATSGIFESYIIVQSNGGSPNYYDLFASTANPDFQGTNFGTFSCTNTLVIKGGQNKTYKNGTDNILNGYVYYKVYKNGTAPNTVSFTSINLGFEVDLGGSGDQQWTSTSGTANILQGLADGTYTIEAYSSADFTFSGGGDTHYQNVSGANYKATFTVSNPISVTVQPTTPTVCFASNTSLSATATGNDAFIWQKQNGVSWTNVSNGNIASGTATTLSLTNVTTTEVYRCLFTNCGGINTFASNAITVTPQRPVISVQPASQTDCDGNIVDFNLSAPTGTSFVWQRKKPSDATFLNISATTNSVITNGIGTSQLKVKNIGNAENSHLSQYQCLVTDANLCTNLSNIAVLSVNSIGNIADSPIICAGGNTSFSTTLVGTSTAIKWQKGASETAAGTYTDLNDNSPNILGTTTSTLSLANIPFLDNNTFYRVKVTFTTVINSGTGSCTQTQSVTASSTGKLTVNALPTAPTVTDDAKCGTNSITVSASGAASGQNYKWYADNVSTTPIQTNGATYTATISNTTDYYVSIYSTTTPFCESARVKVTAIINPTPTISLGIISDICNSVTSFALPFSATTGTPNEYTISAGSPLLSGFSTITTTLSASPIIVPIPANSAANTYQFTATVRSTTTTCVSNPQNFTVKINATPATPTVISSVNYCQNATTAALSATASGTNTLLWYGTSATGGTSSATAPTPSSASIGTSTYYVSQKNTDNCESARAAISVVIHAKPAAPTTIPVNYCKDATAATLTASTTGSNTLLWYGTSSSGGVSSTSPPSVSTASVGTTSYYVSQISPSPAFCESPRGIITVTVFDHPLTPIVATPIGYCQNATATQLSASTTGTNTLLWYGTTSTGGTSSGTAPMPSTASGGTFSYYVSQKDGNNCESPRAKIDVIVTPTLTSTITGINAFCITGALNNSTTLTANPSGGNGIYTYQWQNLAGNITSATSQTLVTSTANTYKSVISSGYCTATTANLIVTAQGWNDMPSVTGNTPDICGSGTKTLNIGSPSSSGTYKWFTDANTLSETTSGVSFTTPTLSSTTSYFVAREQQITANLTCQTARTQVTINVNSASTAPTITGNLIICSGSSTTLTANGCAGTVLWSNNTSGSTLTISASGTYAATCTENDCVSLASSTKTVIVNTTPTAPTITGNLIICSGSSTTLTANGCAGTILWSNNTSGSTLTISASGTYAATCTENACVSLASSTQTVVVNTTPTAPTITGNLIICSGSSTTLTANGCAGTVLWSNNTSGSTLLVSTAGTYSATCTENACVSLPSLIKTVIVNPIPTAPTITGNLIICSGSSTTLTANGCAGTVLWSNNTSASTLTVSASGTYAATCTENDCVSLASLTKTVVVNPTPTAPTITGNLIICSGSSTTLTANGCAGTILWSNNTSGSTLTISASGTYAATCTENACVSLASSTQTVVVNALPAFATNPTDQTNCKGATSSFSATTNASATLQWEYRTNSAGTFTNVGTAIVGTSHSLSATNIGSVTYPNGSEFRLKATSNGCVTYSTIAILSVNSISGDIPDQTKCNGNSTTFNLSALTIIGTVSSYQWEVSASASSGFGNVSGSQFSGGNSNILTINPTTAIDGIKYYRCKIVFTNTVSGSCTISSNSGKLTVTTITPPTVLGATTICQGQSTNLTASGCAGIITWNNGTTGSVLSASLSGTYTAICTQSSCTSLTSNGHILTVNPTPTAPTISGNLIICSGSSTTLTANGCAGTILWSNNTSGSTLTISASGTYAATCTENACVSLASSTQTIVVNVIPNTPTISGNTSICSGNATTLTASACAGTITWNTGATGSTLSVSSAGTYNAICTVNNCASPVSATQTINVNPIPNAPTISGNTAICQGSNTLLTASGCAGTITWSTGATGNSVSVSAGTYSATCTENSCISAISSVHTITENPLPSITLTPVNSLCNATVNFDLPYSVTTNSPDKYSLSSLMPDFTATNEINLPISPITITIPAGKTGTHSFTIITKNSTTTCTSSQTFSVTILPVLVGGSIEISPNSTNCAGYNGGVISSVALASGGKTPYIYQWQSSIDGINFNDISGENAATYDPSVLNLTTYYRRKTSDACNAEAFSSNIHQINIVPDPQITLTDASDKVVCSGNSVSLGATLSGGFGTCSPTWQSSDTPTGTYSSEQVGGTTFTKTLSNTASTAIFKYFRVVYACSGTGSGSCNNAISALVKVTINPLPNVPNTSGGGTICSGASTTLSATGCNGNLLWSNNSTTTTISVSSAGTYTATCTNSCGTSAASNAVVVNITTVNPPVLAGSTSICDGQSTMLTASNCTGIVTWSNGSTGSSISVSPNITTLYTASCTENTCTSLVSNSVTVTVAPSVDFTVGSVADLCNAATSFSLPYTSTLGSPDKYSLTSAMSNFGAITDANLPASPILVTIPSGKIGTFSFILTQKISATGCSKTQTFSVTILPVLVGGSIEVSPNSTNCAGYNGGAISSVALVSGGKTPYVYQWQNSTDGINFTDISGENATTYDPPVLNLTTYYRRKASDACNTEAFSSNIHQINIVPDPQITLTDASDKVICSGNGISLSATLSGGFGTCSPTWQSSDTPTGTYTSEQAGGTSFNKTLSNTTGTAIFKYFRVVYACSGTGSGSCNNAISAVVKVTINPLPNVPNTSGGGTICSGASTTLSATGCNGNLLWSNNSTTTTISVSSAGTYTATCTNSCGTSAASNAVVVNVTTINPPVLAGTTTICDGQSTTLTASNCAGIVTWSNGSTGPSISVSPNITTLYTATCTENTCTSLVSNSVTITVAPSIDFTVGNVADLCNAATSFSLPYTSTLGSPDKYSLTSAMPNFIVITDANLPSSPISIIIPSGQTGTFSFTLTKKISATGCSKTQTFSVTILPVLTGGSIEVSPNSTNCAGYNGGAISSVALVSGGKTPYVYQWQNSTDGINFTDISGENATTYDPPVLNLTTYYRRKASDACNTEAFSSNIHQINIVPDPQITITDATDKVVCSGNSLSLSATLSGGFGTCSPTWQSSDTPTGTYGSEQVGGTSFTKTLSNTTSTAIFKYFRVVYACSGTGSGSCNNATSAVVKVTVNFIPSQPLITPASVVICPTQSTLLTASGCTGLVTWAGGQTGSTLSVSTTGSYSAICAVNNCVSLPSLPSIVTVASGGLPVSAPTISGTATICSGQSTDLIATNCTGLVSWSNGTTGSNISVNPSLSTTYTANCFDGTCTSNASNQVLITVNAYPTINTQPKNEADCNGNSVTFTVSASTATAYQWQRKIPNGSFINITGANTNSLTISNVGSATDPNLTQYQVIISNATCLITSNTAVLTVNSVTGSLANKTICEGTNTTFDLSTISTTGTIQSYQWQKRVGTSGTWIDISGANATILTINNATNADEQYYRCKINFTVSTSTCARYTTEVDANGAKLTVLVAATPAISGNNAICLGKSTMLTANNCEGNITWSSGQTTTVITVSPSVNTSYSVTCASTQCNFSGTSAPYLVTVNITPQPVNITYDVVSPTTLVFSARTNVPNGTILWYNRATGGTSTSTAPTFTAIGTYAYWVTQTDPSTGCESARLPVIAKVLNFFQITEHPNTQADCKGNSVYMNVTALAPNPVFTYQWQRKRPSEANFSNLTEDGNGIRGWFSKTMIVSNVGDENNPHLSQYRCVVSNAGQNLFSNISTLSVNSVVGALPNVGVCVGGNTGFNLPSYFNITGNVLSYQWQTRLSTSGIWTNLTDGNGISGSATNDLKFANVTYDKGVYYRCSIKFNTQDFECTESTDPAQLIVSGYPSAPYVSNLFYCQFSNAAKLKVESPVQNLVWYSQASGGNATNTAPTPNTNTAGTFLYYVADRTDQGCESPRAEIKVEVGALPAAPINTTPSLTNEGNILTFSADGSQKNGQVLHWFTSPTTTTFTTTAPTFASAGTYTRYVAQLSAFGCLGSRTAITASIIPSLKFTKQPISQADCDGNSVNFNVTASGSNAISYQWQRQKPNETSFSNMTNEIANILTIKDIGSIENPNLSKYRCIIKDEKGTVTSEEAGLTVNKILGTLSNVSLCDGKATKLNLGSLTFTGKIVSYQWQKKMDDIYTDIPTDKDGISIVNEAATYRGRIVFFMDEKNTCIRTTDDLKVDVKPTPVAPQVANQAICLNTNFNLEKSVSATNSLLWYDAFASTASEKTAPKIDQNKLGKTTFFVSQITIFGCESERKTFDLLVSAIPAKPTVSDVSYCRNAPSVALTATTDKENALLWYASNTSSMSTTALIPDTKTDGTVNYFVSAKNTANCESERVGIKVNVAPCIATFDNNFNNCVQVSAENVKGNQWYDLYDNAGKLYASVNPNGLDLGKVSISIRHYGRGSGAIPKTQNDTKFMARYIDFQSATLKTFDKPVSLRIFYQNDELNDYKTASNLPNLSINDFNIVHYDGKNEDCGFENNDNYKDGNSVVIYKNVVGNQIAKEFFYLQFDVNEFSENGATANDFTEITFSGKETDDKMVKLNWQTKFEIKAEKFILERSADCKNFISLGEIKANGTNSNYERLDNQPLSGKSCYRLVYIDKDGTKKYLDPIEVNFTDRTPICTVFPNPWTTGDVVNLYTRNIKEKEIKLYDMLGQEYSFNWKKDELGIIRIRPDVYLNKGTHFVVVIGEDGSRCVQKIVINP